MCGEFGEVSGIIDLVINFLAGGTLFLNSYDTLSYAFKAFMILSYNSMHQFSHDREQFYLVCNSWPSDKKCFKDIEKTFDL